MKGAGQVRTMGSINVVVAEYRSHDLTELDGCRRVSEHDGIDICTCLTS